MLFDNLEHFKAVLEEDNAESFVERVIFDRIPYIFNEDRAQFISWKRSLAAALEVDAACVTVIGSAGLGWSLNPYKNWKAYDESSDVDIAIVSPYHFTVAWRYLRNNPTRRLTIDRRTRIAWDLHEKNYIYWGTIATDKLLGVLPFGKPWLRATSLMASVDPTINRDVKMRVYNDFESLRSYQTRSIAKARETLFQKR